jgi:hypothetical protein
MRGFCYLLYYYIFETTIFKHRGNVDKMTPQVKMTPIEIFNVFELSAFLNREVT